MPWNPFQFKYQVTYIQDEGENAILELQKGSQIRKLSFPRQFLPPDLPIGASFYLHLEDPQTAQSSETHALKSLLETLIQ